MPDALWDYQPEISADPMIVETPLDFDWNVAMEQLASLPRQSEWEEYVSAFQLCNSDASSAQKWRLMDRMFYLYE